jgi:transposase
MWGFAMAGAIELRDDYDGARLRDLAKRSDDSNQTRRLLALAVVYDGGRRRDAAELGGVTLQVVRDWVLRLNAEGSAGLIDRKAPGQAAKLDTAQRQALAERVERGPIPAVDGVVRWRLVDLVGWIRSEYGITVSPATMSRMLKAMGYVKLSARPRHHAQNEYALEAFKKASPTRWRWSKPRSRSARR